MSKEDQSLIEPAIQAPVIVSTHLGTGSAHSQISSSLSGDDDFKTVTRGKKASSQDRKEANHSTNVGTPNTAPGNTSNNRSRKKKKKGKLPATGSTASTPATSTVAASTPHRRYKGKPKRKQNEGKQDFH